MVQRLAQELVEWVSLGELLVLLREVLQSRSSRETRWGCHSNKLQFVQSLRRMTGRTGIAGSSDIPILLPIFNAVLLFHAEMLGSTSTLAVLAQGLLDSNYLGCHSPA